MMLSDHCLASLDGISYPWGAHDRLPPKLSEGEARERSAVLVAAWLPPGHSSSSEDVN